MAKYLFLTSDYLPNLDANGIITKIIINGLQDKGHEVVVLSTKSTAIEKSYEVLNNTSIHRVTQSNYEMKLNQYKDNPYKKKLLNLERRLLNLKYLKNLPNFDPDLTQDTYLKAYELIKNEKIDHVIAVVRPFSNIDVLPKLAKDYPTKVFGIYYLDLLTGLNKPSFMPNKLYNRLIENSYSRTLEVVDFALVPESGKTAIKPEILSKYSEKIKFVDFPTFNPEKNYVESNNTTNEISMTYAGTLNKIYRNPDIFLKVMKSVYRGIPEVRINLFGNNVLDDYKNYDKNDSFIVNQGFQNKEVVDQYNLSADLLINISNTYTNIVPSKIFELFSSGKPIINFVKNPNDFTLNYFIKYPLAFNFLEWEDNEKQIEKLIEFIQENVGKRVEIKDLLPLFEKNTPEYTIEAIESATID